MVTITTDICTSNYTHKQSSLTNSCSHTHKTPPLTALYPHHYAVVTAGLFSLGVQWFWPLQSPPHTTTTDSLRVSFTISHHHTFTHTHTATTMRRAVLKTTTTTTTSISSSCVGKAAASLLPHHRNGAFPFNMMVSHPHTHKIIHHIYMHAPPAAACA